MFVSCHLLGKSKVMVQLQHETKQGGQKMTEKYMQAQQGARQQDRGRGENKIFTMFSFFFFNPLNNSYPHSLMLAVYH